VVSSTPGAVVFGLTWLATEPQKYIELIRTYQGSPVKGRPKKT